MALQITTKGCYGLRALVDLAKQPGDSPILLGSVAERIGVSRKYLHALMVTIKEAGMIRSIRGSGGGYLLNRDPREITVAEVVQALEGGFILRDCVADESICEKSAICVTRRLWHDLGLMIESHLSGVTLQDLVDRGETPWQDPPFIPTGGSV